MHHEIVSVNPDIEARFYLSIDSGSYVPPHWHDSLELVYMIEGTMTVIFENRREVLHSGEFNIVNSRVIHSVLSEKNEALVLQIPKEILRKFIPNIELYTFTVDQKEFDRNEGQFEKVIPVMNYLKEHYREKCMISELAEHFGYHEDYIARIFKKQLGMTITEYLYAIRISKVYIDLINTDHTVNDIFEAHGCTNYKVAMRHFKEKYGCTPKEKREIVRHMSWKE